MSIVRAITNANGPATVDIQIEQGADFSLPVEILRLGAASDLSGDTIEAWMSSQYAEGPRINFTITPVNLTLGTFEIELSRTESLNLTLPPRDGQSPNMLLYGTWVLHIRGNEETRFVNGKVYLDRVPWQE